MSWAAEQAARIRLEGAALSVDRRAVIVERFRRVGGAYELLAAQIDVDHGPTDECLGRLDMRGAARVLSNHAERIG